MASALHQNREADGVAREHGPHGRHSSPIVRGDRAVRLGSVRVNIALCAPSVAGTDKHFPIPALLKTQAIVLSEMVSAAEETIYRGAADAPSSLFCRL